MRFWPGATADRAGEYLPSHLSGPSEWLHEREWRTPVQFEFSWDAVQFLIVPDINWQAFYADWIAGWAGNLYGQVFRSLPAVVMTNAGAGHP